MAQQQECNTAYFDGMDKLGKTHKHFLWIAAAAYFFDQMDLALFGFIAPILQTDLGFSLQQIADMNSASFLGMFFGGIFAGWLSNKIGRKKGLLVCITLFSVGSIINGLSAHFLTFITMRFAVGFGVIGMVVIAMVYMAEMLPSNKRGKYQALTIASGTIGIPFGALYANFVIPSGPHGWRLVFFLGGSGILLVPLGLKWLKESPRWLVSQRRIKEAEEIVTACTGKPCDLSSQLTNCAESIKVGIGEVLKVMFSKALLKQTCVVVILVIGVTLGTFYTQNWTTIFLVDLGWDYSLVLAMGALAALGTPLGDVLVSFISDKGGRRIPIIIFCIINFCLLTVYGYLMPLTVNVVWIAIIMNLAKSMFTCGTMTMLWTYLAESFPTRIRSTATGMIFSTGRLLAAVTAFTVPIFYHGAGMFGGFFGVNFINGLMFGIPAILAIFFGANTANRSLEDLEKSIEAK